MVNTTDAIRIVMAWLAAGGAYQMRQERFLMRLAAIYGMLWVTLPYVWGGSPFYGPGLHPGAYSGL